MHTLAKTYLEEYWNLKFPVKVTDIANQLGISIHVTSLEENQVAYVEPNKHRIWLNREEGLTRQKFAVAYALLHLAKNNGEPLSVKLEDFQTTTLSAFNQEASQFALDLLLPPENLKADIVARKILPSFSDLAKQLEVSEVALRHQLLRYRIISE